MPLAPPAGHTVNCPGAGCSNSCVSCRFSGATCGLALVFVFPSLVHVMSLRRRGLLRWPSVLLHSLLILLGVANLLAQFLM